jgi:hypothetical protein
LSKEKLLVAGPDSNIRDYDDRAREPALARHPSLPVHRPLAACYRIPESRLILCQPM